MLWGVDTFVHHGTRSGLDQASRRGKVQYVLDTLHVGPEHLAQRVQALHLAVVADQVLGQAEDRNTMASTGDDVFVQKASTSGPHSNEEQAHSST